MQSRSNDLRTAPNCNMHMALQLTALSATDKTQSQRKNIQNPHNKSMSKLVTKVL